MSSVLVVDDEQHVRRLMQRSLTNAGYDVEIAGSGREALEKLEQRSFDVLITDVGMPGMTGVELCDQLLERLPDRKPLIFVVTSRSEEELRDWAEGRERLEFIEKPVSLRHLMSRLRLHLGGED